jgi:hypothetical protein
MMDRQTNLKWGLISFLAVLGLVRPLLSITDTYEVLGPSSWAPVIVTVLIAILWVGVVVIKRDPNPLVTILATGGLYGVLAILLQQIIWNFFLGETSGGGSLFRAGTDYVVGEHRRDQCDLGHVPWPRRARASTPAATTRRRGIDRGMEISRKRFLKLGLAGGVVLTLPFGVSACSGSGDGSTGTLLPSKAKLPEPFQAPLPVPSVLEPARSDASADYYEMVPEGRQSGDPARPPDGGLGLRGDFPRPYRRVPQRSEDRGAPAQRSSRTGLDTPARRQDATRERRLPDRLGHAK